MRINLPSLIIIVFVCCWVLGDIFGSTYEQNLLFSLFATLSFSIFNNAHGMAFKQIKKLIKK